MNRAGRVSTGEAESEDAREIKRESAACQFIFVFSVVFPVPINNRIAKWDPEDLPNDWRELRRRWDKLHYVRIVLLLSALACLIWGTVKH
jgi:hypothetical protein